MDISRINSNKSVLKAKGNLFDILFNDRAEMSSIGFHFMVTSCRHLCLSIPQSRHAEPCSRAYTRSGERLIDLTKSLSKRSAVIH